MEKEGIQPPDGKLRCVGANASRGEQLYGRTFVSKPMPLEVSCGLLAAATSIVLALGTGQIAWIRFGVVAAIAIAAVFWCFRPKPFQLTIARDGIMLSPPQRFWAFDETLDVFVSRRRAFLLLRFGTEPLPEKLGVDWNELRDLVRLRASSQRLIPVVPPPFEAYFCRQMESHPLESIYVYHGNPTKKPWFSVTVAKWAGASWLMATMWLIHFLWSSEGFRHGEDIACVTGILSAAIVGTLLLGAACLTTIEVIPKVRNAAESFMILSASGMTARQGNCQFEMKWGEMSRLRFDKAQAAITFLRGRTSVTIHDVYQWPIEHIADVIGAFTGRLY